MSSDQVALAVGFSPATVKKLLVALSLSQLSTECLPVTVGGKLLHYHVILKLIHKNWSLLKKVPRNSK